jgi:8-oxo-dGTP pyrophosphatase MutT (NUDIX family)
MRMQERFKMIAFVSLILRRGSEVLLIRRFNTGFEDGMYGCAGGGVDENEPITQALVREAYEELGINLKKRTSKRCSHCSQKKFYKH